MIEPRFVLSRLLGIQTRTGYDTLEEMDAFTGTLTECLGLAQKYLGDAVLENCTLENGHFVGPFPADRTDPHRVIMLSVAGPAQPAVTHRTGRTGMRSLPRP